MFEVMIFHQIFNWIKKNEYGMEPKWNFINISLIETELTSSWSSMTKPDHSKILKEINKVS